MTAGPRRPGDTGRRAARDVLRVWIDLDNTPHASFFRPIARELTGRGHEVLVTARDHGQTVELARLFGLSIRVIGGWRGHRTAAKAAATLWRAGRLAVYGASRSVDVAVSHGSRPLVLAARVLAVPSVTLYDYEGASTGLFHRLSAAILVPAAVGDAVRSRGGPAQVVTYEGVKEQLYLSDFEPAPAVRDRLGWRADDLVVVLRPEAEMAHYHPIERRPLMEAALDRLATDPRVRVAVLPRGAAQARRLGALLDARGIRWEVPEAVDGRELIWAADLVLGGGGTMTREAAVLGVPSYSVFQGPPGGADRVLEEQGRLTLLREPADADRIRLESRARGEPAPAPAGRDLLRFVTDQICAAGRPSSG